MVQKEGKNDRTPNRLPYHRPLASSWLWPFVVSEPMNRRELFKGLGAALAAASIPFPAFAFERASNSEALAFLERLLKDLAYKLANPPLVLIGNRVFKLDDRATSEAFDFAFNMYKGIKDGSIPDPSQSPG